MGWIQYIPVKPVAQQIFLIVTISQFPFISSVSQLYIGLTHIYVFYSSRFRSALGTEALPPSEFDSAIIPSGGHEHHITYPSITLLM